MLGGAGVRDAWRCWGKGCLEVLGKGMLGGAGVRDAGRCWGKGCLEVLG